MRIGEKMQNIGIKDGHVHLSIDFSDYDSLKQKWEKQNIKGGLFISEPPGENWKQRIENVLKWKKEIGSSYAFLWINPFENDIENQMKYAVDKGIDGFKAICENYNPMCEKAQNAWRLAGELEKPMLFHTGILIGAGNSEYCRPLYYEGLFQIPRLRFCLAHISWPWVDECIGLCAKWRNCQILGKTTAELYIDTTPGTPLYSRKTELGKLWFNDFDMKNNIIFGTDLRTNYKEEKMLKYKQRDNEFFEENNLIKDREKYFSKNLDSFVNGLI